MDSHNGNNEQSGGGWAYIVFITVCIYMLYLSISHMQPADSAALQTLWYYNTISLKPQHSIRYI